MLKICDAVKTGGNVIQNNTDIHYFLNNHHNNKNTNVLLVSCS